MKNRKQTLFPTVRMRNGGRSTQSQRPSRLFAEFAAKLYGMTRIIFGDGIAGITGLHRVADQQAKCRMIRRPERLCRRGKIQKMQQIMCFRDAQSSFLQSRFEIFFHCLLNVETDYVPKWFLAPTVECCRGKKIFLGLQHPLTRTCLHTSFDRNAERRL
jgi:hypothetical protein